MKYIIIPLCNFIENKLNGEPQFPAVYVYYIEGVCTNNQKIVKQGNVSLIR
ncbi:MAG: hypothetical protein ACK5AS_09765 [Bacteroidota bacterium]